MGAGARKGVRIDPSGDSDGVEAVHVGIVGDAYIAVAAVEEEAGAEFAWGPYWAVVERAGVAVSGGVVG